MKWWLRFFAPAREAEQTDAVIQQVRQALTKLDRALSVVEASDGKPEK